MNEERIKKVEEFINTELMKLSNYHDNNIRSAKYRIEHSYRVAYILKEIAKYEGFDEEKAFVAGLLHDIGYSVYYKTYEEFVNHGRDGARIARPFLKELGYSFEDVEDICYGIAIHCDDKADFEGERTLFALSVGDADNIDRFDAFRVYETLHNKDYKNMSISEQKEFVNLSLEKLGKLKQVKFSTPTACAMWEEKIKFQIEFYNKLKNQAEHSY